MADENTMAEFLDEMKIKLLQQYSMPLKTKLIHMENSNERRKGNTSSNQRFR